MDEYLFDIDEDTYTEEHPTEEGFGIQRRPIPKEEGFGIQYRPIPKEKTFDTYTVKPGDSLTKIVKNKFNMAPRTFFDEYQKQLQPLNPEITDPNKIYPGQVIRLPKLLPKKDEIAKQFAGMPDQKIEMPKDEEELKLEKEGREKNAQDIFLNFITKDEKKKPGIPGYPDYKGTPIFTPEREMALAKKYPNLMAARFAVLSLLPTGEILASPTYEKEFKELPEKERALRLTGELAAWAVIPGITGWLMKAGSKVVVNKFPWMAKPVLKLLFKDRVWFQKLDLRVKGLFVNTIEQMQKAGYSEAQILKALKLKGKTKEFQQYYQKLWKEHGGGEFKAGLKSLPEKIPTRPQAEFSYYWEAGDKKIPIYKITTPEGGKTDVAAATAREKGFEIPKTPTYDKWMESKKKIKVNEKRMKEMFDNLRLKPEQRKGSKIIATPEEIIELRKKGVSESILRALQKEPTKATMQELDMETGELREVPIEEVKELGDQFKDVMRAAKKSKGFTDKELRSMQDFGDTIQSLVKGKTLPEITKPGMPPRKAKTNVAQKLTTNETYKIRDRFDEIIGNAVKANISTEALGDLMKFRGKVESRLIREDRVKAEELLISEESRLLKAFSEKEKMYAKAPIERRMADYPEISYEDKKMLKQVWPDVRLWEMEHPALAAEFKARARRNILKIPEYKEGLSDKEVLKQAQKIYKIAAPTVRDINRMLEAMEPKTLNISYLENLIGKEMDLISVIMEARKLEKAYPKQVQEYKDKFKKYRDGIFILERSVARNIDKVKRIGKKYPEEDLKVLWGLMKKLRAEAMFDKISGGLDYEDATKASFSITVGGKTPKENPIKKELESVNKPTEKSELIKELEDLLSEYADMKPEEEGEFTMKLRRLIKIKRKMIKKKYKEEYQSKELSERQQKIKIKAIENRLKKFNKGVTSPF